MIVMLFISYQDRTYWNHLPPFIIFGQRTKAHASASYTSTDLEVLGARCGLTVISVKPQKPHDYAWFQLIGKLSPG